jgi:hypothetical protein
MIRLLSDWRIKREIARNLAKRKVVRKAESERARDAVSRQWKRRGEMCREVFG